MSDHVGPYWCALVRSPDRRRRLLIDQFSTIVQHTLQESLAVAPGVKAKMEQPATVQPVHGVRKIRVEPAT